MSAQYVTEPCLRDHHDDCNKAGLCCCACHYRDEPRVALTGEEREAITMAGQLWNRLCKIVGSGPTREADLNELVVHIHAIQQAVMSQAAGRSYPTEFRLLGQTLRDGAELG